MKKKFSKLLAIAMCLTVTAAYSTPAFAASPTTHNWDDGTVTKEATCYSEGEITSKCTDDGCEAIQVEKTARLDHTWSGWGYHPENGDKLPTCTEEGQVSRECMIDGCDVSDSVQTKTVAANGHTWGAWTTKSVATCTNKEVQERTCTVCGAKDTQEVGEALGHDYDANGDGVVTEADGVVTKEATCTATGVRTYTCQICGATKEDTIAKKEHNWEATKTVDVAPTCTTKGSKSIHCADCDATKDAEDIEATGHNFSTEYTLDKPATCTEDGQKSQHCQNANCDAKQNVTTIKAFGHDYIRGIETPATCTEDAFITFYCANYGCDSTYVKTRENTALGHDWAEEATVDKAATCTEDGQKSIHCERCNAINEDTITSIDATGHNYVHYKKAAGNLVDGIEYDYCTNCDDRQNVVTHRGYNNVKASGVKVSASKKAFTAKWSKTSSSNLKKLSGYQVRYSTKSNMSGAKTVSVSKSSTSKKISKLSAKKKYYVQVRSYAKINGYTYYSNWSNTKSVKTKR